MTSLLQTLLKSTYIMKQWLIVNIIYVHNRKNNKFIKNIRLKKTYTVFKCENPISIANSIKV